MVEKTKIITSICPEFKNGRCKLGVALTKVISTGMPTRQFDSLIECPKLGTYMDNCAVRMTVPESFVTKEQ